MEVRWVGGFDAGGAVHAADDLTHRDGITFFDRRVILEVTIFRNVAVDVGDYDIVAPLVVFADIGDFAVSGGENA